MSANRVRAALATALLAALAIVLAACGQEGSGQTGKNDEELVDNGPNAGLSNGELVNMAVTNMRQLSSFHMEFSGPAVIGDMPVQEVNLLADVHLRGPGDWSGGEAMGEGIYQGTPVPGSRFKLSMKAETGQVGESLPTDVEFLWASDGAFYGSSDGGQTWQAQPYALIILSYFIFPWEFEGYWGPPRTEGTPIAASSGLTFTDGSPRLEMVEGVITRHVVADVSNVFAYGPWDEPPNEIDLWISTGTTPTVHKLVAKGNRTAPSTPVTEDSLGSPEEVALSPDGRMLAVAYGPSWSGDASERATPTPVPPPGVQHEIEGTSTLRVWDLTRPGAAPQVLHAQGTLASISFSGDGRYLAAGRSEDGATTVWDLGSQTPVATSLSMPVPTSSGPQLGNGKVAMRPDGKMVAAITTDGLYVWELPAGSATQPRLICVNGERSLKALAFSPDNHTLAVSVSSEEVVRLYDVRDPASVRSLTRGGDTERLWNPPFYMAFSADGNLLAGTSTNPTQVRIWDLRQADPSPSVIGCDARGSAAAIAFTPSGGLLSVHLASTESARKPTLQAAGTCEMGDSQAIPVLLLAIDTNPGDSVTALAFGADGKSLVATSNSGSVLLWTLDALQAQRSVKAVPTAQVIADPQASEQPVGAPFTLTWTWSRFNEDFGEVKPPPTETIREP